MAQPCRGTHPPVLRKAITALAAQRAGQSDKHLSARAVI